MDENKYGPIEAVDINTIHLGKIRIDKLPSELYQRAKKIFELTYEVQYSTFREFEENFRRDLNPLSEIIIWERIAKVYSTFISNHNFILKKKEVIFNFILVSSLNPNSNNFPDSELLSENERRKLYKLYFKDPTREVLDGAIKIVNKKWRLLILISGWVKKNMKINKNLNN